MFDRLVGVLAPHICLVCGEEGSLLCGWCATDTLDVIPERCYRCSTLSQDAAVCAKCQSKTPLRHVWVRTIYKDVPKMLVQSLKFSRAKDAITVITVLLDDLVPFLSPETVVSYVPTATSRVRQRGYDQSRLIAQRFARQRGLACTSLLVRHGQARQVGSDRKHRITQAAGNYTVIDSERVRGAKVLLIDDIMTTGATIEAAARALKKAGAKQVNAAIFAQKQ